MTAITYTKRTFNILYIYTHNLYRVWKCRLQILDKMYVVQLPIEFVTCHKNTHTQTHTHTHTHTHTERELKKHTHICTHSPNTHTETHKHTHSNRRLKAGINFGCRGMKGY